MIMLKLKTRSSAANLRNELETFFFSISKDTIYKRFFMHRKPGVLFQDILDSFDERDSSTAHYLCFDENGISALGSVVGGEFAIIVRDDVQNMGIGAGMLRKICDDYNVLNACVEHMAVGSRRILEKNGFEFVNNDDYCAYYRRIGE